MVLELREPAARRAAVPAVTTSPSDPLVLAVVATLPLTQAMTLDVGFPLKAYEVLVVVASAIWLLRTRRVVAGVELRVAVVCSAGLLIAATAGLAYALLDPGRPVDRGLYRLGAELDGALQLAYLGLAVVSLALVAELASRHPRAVVTWWLRGALVASGYALAVNAMSVAGLSPILLPGGSEQIANLGGLVVYRAGTFLEGNFFGLYLLVSLTLALLVRRRSVAVVLTVALLLSLSTLSIAAAGIVWTVATMHEVRRGRSVAAVAVALAALVVVVLLLPRDFYQSVVVEKLQDPRSQSSLERRGTATAGLGMFADRPVTGVGIAQYGLWFPRHRPGFVPPDFLPPGGRYIANNVYVQVAAEQGLIGLVPFLLLLGAVLRAALATRSVLVVTGATMVLLCLNAFPSLSVVFVWAFFGVVLGLASHRRRRPADGYR